MQSIAYGKSLGISFLVFVLVFIKIPYSFSQSSTGWRGGWTCIGPDSLPVQAVGYVFCVWGGSGNDTNVIFAGTVGGLFRTEDGGGHWKCVTDHAAPGAGLFGVTSICVNPLNKNSMFAGTAGNSKDPGGAGILRSSDFGKTWQQELIYGDSTAQVQGVFISPDSAHLYAFKGNSVFTRSNIAGDLQVWMDITPPGNYRNWTDLKFIPGSKDTFFISNSDMRSSIWMATTSVPGSSDWIEISRDLIGRIGGAVVNSNDWGLLKLAIPVRDSMYVLAMANSQMASLYTYHIPTATFNELYSNLPGIDLSMSRGKGQLAVSRVRNASGYRDIFYGRDVVFYSGDGGHTFRQVSRYWADPTHGDVRGVYLQPNPNAGNTRERLLFATDGGVGVTFKDSEGNVDSRDISGKGLHCGTFWSYQTSEAGGMGIGGMMHDGVVTWQPDAQPRWKNMGISDAWACAINKAQPQKAYCWEWYNDLYETVADTARQMAWISPAFPEPSDYLFLRYGVGAPIKSDLSGNLYCGQNGFYRKRPTDYTFIELPHMRLNYPSPDQLACATFTFNHYDTAYIGYVLYNGQDSQLLCYRNAYAPGWDVARQVNIPMNSNARLVSSIATDPFHTERIWLVRGGKQGSTDNGIAVGRAFYSNDTGFTWVDISAGLPQKYPATKIIFDETTHMLYCGTEMGVFRYNCDQYQPAATINGKNSSAVWQPFNNALGKDVQFPHVTITDLDINHCEGMLYAATFGRSVWRTTLDSVGKAPIPTDTIRENTTWSGGRHHYINGGIYIMPGYALNVIDDTIHMPANGALMVPKGARLNVKRAHITNSCTGCTWQGIKAEVQDDVWLVQSIVDKAAGSSGSQGTKKQTATKSKSQRKTPVKKQRAR